MISEQVNVWTYADITAANPPAQAPVETGTIYTNALVYNFSPYWLNVQQRTTGSPFAIVRPWAIVPISLQPASQIFISIAPGYAKTDSSDPALLSNQKVSLFLRDYDGGEQTQVLSQQTQITGGTVQITATQPVNVTVPEPLEIVNVSGGSLNVTTQQPIEITNVPEQTLQVSIPSSIQVVNPLGESLNVTTQQPLQVTNPSSESLNVTISQELQVVVVSGKNTVSLTTNSVVKSSSGVVGTIINTDSVTSGTITIYDNTSSASGTIIWSGTLTTGQVLPLNIPVSNGIYASVASGTTCTLSYS